MKSRGCIIFLIIPAEVKSSTLGIKETIKKRYYNTKNIQIFRLNELQKQISIFEDALGRGRDI